MLRPATGESATPRMPFFPVVVPASVAGPPGSGGNSCCSAGGAAGDGPPGSGGNNGDEGDVLAVWVGGTGAHGSAALFAAGAALAGGTADFGACSGGLATGSEDFAAGSVGFAAGSAGLGVTASAPGWAASFAGGGMGAPSDTRAPRVGRGSGNRVLKGWGVSPAGVSAAAPAGAAVCALSCASSARIRCSMHCTFRSSSSFEGAGAAACGMGADGLPPSPRANLSPMLNMAAAVSRTIDARRGLDIEIAPPASSIGRDGWFEAKLHVETGTDDPSRVAVREVSRPQCRTDERIGVIRDPDIKHLRPQTDVAGDRQLAADTSDPTPAPIVEAELIPGDIEVGRERVSRSTPVGAIKQRTVRHDASTRTGRNQSVESAGDRYVGIRGVRQQARRSDSASRAAVKLDAEEAMTGRPIVAELSTAKVAWVSLGVSSNIDELCVLVGAGGCIANAAKVEAGVPALIPIHIAGLYWCFLRHALVRSCRGAACQHN